MNALTPLLGAVASGNGQDLAKNLGKQTYNQIVPLAKDIVDSLPSGLLKDAAGGFASSLKGSKDGSAQENTVMEVADTATKLPGILGNLPPDAIKSLSAVVKQTTRNLSRRRRKKKSSKRSSKNKSKRKRYTRSRSQLRKATMKLKEKRKSKATRSMKKSRKKYIKHYVGT